MSEETEKYNQALKKFKEKIASLKKRRADVFKNISTKLDQQKIESIRKKLKDNE